MDDAQTFIQLITLSGAAGVLYYVLKLIVDGKLHSSSEVEGLRSDKTELLKINSTMQTSLADANEKLANLVELLRGQHHA